MFNCRNNLTFKAFLPFYLEIRTGDLAMESLGTGAQGGGQGGRRKGGKVLFLLFALLAFTLFTLFAFTLFTLFAFYFKV